MGCGCDKKKTQWQVKYPNGKKVVFQSQTQAKLAAARVTGAKVEKVKP